MPRINKFRAKDKKTKKWHYFDLPYDLFNYQWLDDKDRYENWTEYTGLKDKNGKEIYDGDIVKYTEHEGYLLKDFIGDFQYVQFGYMIKTPTSWIELARIDELQKDLLNHLEIIGNIYENPELIK